MVKSLLKNLISFIKPFSPYIIEVLIKTLPITGGITLTGVFALGGRFFTNIAEVQVPLFILIALSPLVIYAVVKIARGVLDIARDPPYLMFTGMKYEYWKLVWEYSYNKKSDEYEIKNLRPVCKKCGCDMVEHKENDSFCRCPQCPQHISPPDFHFDRHVAAMTVIKYRMKQWSDKSVNLQPTPIEIYNTLSEHVTLSAGGYLGAEPVTIYADCNETGCTIYTKTPAFSVSTEDSSPAITNYQIIDGVMIVTIR